MSYKRFNASSYVKINYFLIRITQKNTSNIVLSINAINQRVN